jgi:hypothetical protein
MRKLFSILSLVLLYITIAFGQAVDIPITVTDNAGASQIINFGLDPTASDGIDAALGESDLPPPPPGNAFDARWWLPPFGGALSSWKDYRNAPAFPYTGSVQYSIKFQSTDYPITISWDLPPEIDATSSIEDVFGGVLFQASFSGTNSAVITNAGIAQLNVFVDYNGIGPAGPAPIFTIDPASLDFGSVTVGNNATLPATVTNTGDADLVISGIVSSDGQFTFSPVAPVTVSAGGSQVFDVTFSPTGVGAQSADIVFTHNADGSPTTFSVQGTGVAGPVPVFSIAPASLNFGSVFLGDFSTLSATVTNTGTADLVIDNLTSSNGQFTFSPNSFPITITPGSNQAFDVTFTPSAAGSQAATLQFTHNASGSPTSYSVQGVGVDPSPVFSVNPASLSFGNVDVGTSADLSVTVSNTGTLDPLVISSAAIAAAEFTVVPASANIPAGGSQLFTVTFSPPAAGPYTGTLVFTDNAAGSPHNVGLTGNGYVPPAVFGLIFEKDTVHQLEDASYTEIMQLKGLDSTTDKVHAIQFRLAVNKASGDNTILTFQNIQKGSDVAGTGWILDYNVVRGPITGNGASVDSIYVLLYNLNENGGLDPANDYNNLFTVKYKIANLPALTDSLKSSIVILHAEASTKTGYPIDITPSLDELTVWGINRVSSLGDVNGDGCLDILDLIMVVDHITGRDSLTGDFFTRADIAPWSPGAQEPNPDGFVNVQDLSLIQNIILTGMYPDGTTINGCSYAGLGKIAGDVDAKVTFYINSDGITANLESRFDIRGAQVEFANVINNPQNLVINTALGQGYYMKVNDLLRTVMYDRLANKFIESGDHFMADMPFHINNPEELTLDKIILVNTDKQKLQKIQVEIVYGSAPSLPLDYILFQNYPNPFNPTTTVKFEVPQTSDVSVKIYNMLGQEIRTLFSSQVQRGNYSVQWDGMNDAGVKMSSGTYIYRMTAGSFVQSKKMVLLK